MMKFRRLIIFFILFLCLCVLLVFLEFRIKGVREQLSEYTAMNKAAGAILDGIHESIENTYPEYSKITKIERDENGNVKSVVTDTAKLNHVANIINKKVDSKINSMKSYPVSLPLSSVVGSQLLSGLGPDIRFYVTLTGTSSTEFENRFESSGINQTRHQIILNVSVDTYVIFGKKIKKYTARTELCIAENIIVGLTPDFVSNLKNEPQK